MGGSVAVALTWKQLFAYNGAMNGVLGAIGLEPIKWLNDPNTALGVLISLGIWQFGSSMLIFLAAIKNVPRAITKPPSWMERAQCGAFSPSYCP